VLAMKRSGSLASRRKTAAPHRGPKTFPEFANDSDDRFSEYFRGLPGTVREARVQIAKAPSTLRHLADAIDETMSEFSLDAGGEVIEAASVRIRANVAAATSILVDLAVFAGQLAAVAREAEVMLSTDE